MTNSLKKLHDRCRMTGAGLFILWYLLSASGIQLVHYQLITSSLQSLSVYETARSTDTNSCNCGHDGDCMSDCACSLHTEKDANRSGLFSCAENPSTPNGLTVPTSLQWQLLVTSERRTRTWLFGSISFDEHIPQEILSTVPDKIPKFS